MLDNRVKIFGLLALLLGAAYAARSIASTLTTPDQLPGDAFDTSDPLYQQPEEYFMTSGVNWKVNEYPKYAAFISEAERQQRIPTDLYARLLYQESRYRKDVIEGVNRSPMGALGIAQFMPATAAEMHVDPLDPVAAIYAGARYLKKMYDLFGNWRHALMAYNAGPGNIKAYLDTGYNIYGQPLKQETLDYVAQITADVAVA